MIRKGAKHGPNSHVSQETGEKYVQRIALENGKVRYRVKITIAARGKRPKIQKSLGVYDTVELAIRARDAYLDDIDL